MLTLQQFTDRPINDRRSLGSLELIICYKMAIYNNTSAKQICQQIATQKEENKTNNFLEVKLCSTILPVVLFIQTLDNTERAIKKGQSRETGNIGYTRRRKTKQKHNTICIGHHYIQETRRRQIQQKHNTICVGHHYA